MRNFMRPLVITLLLTSLVGSGFFIYYIQEKSSNIALEEKKTAVALLLADELRNDSRMLTSATRGLIIGGRNAQMEQSIRIIRDIREGRAVRSNTSQLHPGSLIPFGALINSMNLAPEDSGLLLRALNLSEVLADREEQALRMAFGIYPDATGQYTIRGTPDQEKATDMLFGPEYRMRINDINVLLDQYFIQVSQRLALKTSELRNEINTTTIGGTLSVFLVIIAFTALSMQSRSIGSLNSRIVLPSVCTMLGLVLAIAVPTLIVYKDALDITRDAFEKRQRTLATEVVNELSVRMYSATDFLRILSNQPELYRYLASSEKNDDLSDERLSSINRTLRSFTHGYADISQLSMLDAEGHVITSITMEDTDAQINIAPAQLAEVLMGKTKVFTIDNRQSLDVVIAVPVYAHGDHVGAVVGVLMGVLDQQNVLTVWQGRISGEERMVIFVANKDSRIISSSRTPDSAGFPALSKVVSAKVQQGEQGLFIVDDVYNGRQRMVYLQYMHEPQWFVGVASDHTFVQEKVERILMHAFFYCMLAALVSIIMVSLLLQNLTWHLRRSMERTKNIISGAGMFTWEYDARRDNMHLSAKWKKLLRYSPPWYEIDIPLAELLAIVHPDDVLVVKEMLSITDKHNYTQKELRVRSAQKEWIWLQIMGCVEEVDTKGKAVLVTGTGFDINDRKQIQISEVGQKQRLESLVAQRTHELLESRNQAEAASKAKSVFLSTVSHEIRTPMNAIVGFTHLFDRSNLTDIQKDFLGKIDFSASTLLNIINDVLDISKIESGKLELENTTFDLQSILDSVSSMMSHTAQQKNIELNISVRPEVPRYFRGDTKRITQILLNLLNNAIKFTHHGSVSLSVVQKFRDTSCKPNSITLYFEVRDTGIGIDEKQIKRLFKPFSQADSSVTRRFGGTGLGLAICKQLVELMGGQVGIISEVGVGTIVHFTLVLDESTDNANDSAPHMQMVGTAQLQASQVLQGKHVLLVEDNSINQEIALMVLKNVGMHVDIANNGLEALEKVRKTIYDVILMDMQMPLMSGVEATEQMRKMADRQPWLATVPIIAMTANALLEDKIACLEAGMNAHVAKPFEPADLYSLLAQWTSLIRQKT